MKEYFCTYTDAETLRLFVSMKPLESSDDSVDVWRHCYKFLSENTGFCFSDSVSSLNINDENNAAYALIRILVNRYLQGDSSIIFNSEAINKASPAEFVDSDKRQKFVLKEILDNKKLDESNTGCYSKNAAELLKIWRLLSQPKPYLVSKNQGKSERLSSWLQLRDVVHPLNAIVICDNYILGHYYGIHNNLFKLLRVLLPNKHLEIPIDITIISQKFYEINKEEASILEVYKLIFDQLTDMLGPKNFNFTLVKKELQGHLDRYIFTNYYVLNSGNGFNYFNRDGGVITPAFTELKVIPFTAKRDQTDILFDILTEIKHIISTTSKERIIGNGVNRLLNL